MDDKRLTVRLRKHWDMLRGGSNMPDIQHLNPAPIEDLWPNCCTLAIAPGNAGNYKYMYMGAPIIALYGRDMTGQTLDQRMKQFPGSLVSKKLEEVLATQQPAENEGHMVNPQGQMIKYRACFLPFGSEKKGITHVVVGLSYRAF